MRRKSYDRAYRYVHRCGYVSFSHLSLTSSLSSSLPDPSSSHQAHWWLHAPLLPSSEDQEWPQCLLKAHQQPNPRFCSGQVSSFSPTLVLFPLHTLLSWAERAVPLFRSRSQKVRCIFLYQWALNIRCGPLIRAVLEISNAVLDSVLRANCILYFSSINRVTMTEPWSDPLVM